MLDACIEALYFHPSEMSVSYAIHQGKVLNPDFKTHWGARAKAAWGICPNEWQLWLSFLHYHARNSSSMHDGGYQPTWGHPSLNQGQVADTLFNMWRLHLGLADGGLSYPWQISDCVEASLFCFFRYTEVRHKLKIDYTPGEVFSMKNKFWGIGPGFGGEGVFTLTQWLSLFAKGTLNLSFGKFYVHQDQKLDSVGLNVFNEFIQLEPIINGALGLQVCFWSCFFRLGWEAYLFINQNQLARFPDQTMPAVFVSNGGSLTLQGLSLGLEVKF